MHWYETSSGGTLPISSRGKQSYSLISRLAGFLGAGEGRRKFELTCHLCNETWLLESAGEGALCQKWPKFAP